MVFRRRFSRSRYSRRRGAFRRTGRRSSGYSFSRPAARYLQPRVSRNVPRVSTTHFHQLLPIGIFMNTTTTATYSFPYYNTGAILNAVPTANGLSGRIGTRIFMQSLLLSGNVRYSPWGANHTGGTLAYPFEPTMNCTVFLVYFSGRQPPDFTNLPHPFGDFLENVNVVNPQPRLDPDHPYRVIWRKTFTFSPEVGLAASGGSGNPNGEAFYGLGSRTMFTVNKRISLNLPTVFDDSPAPSPTWDTIKQGQLQLMCYYPHNLPAGCVFEFSTRLAFVEY